MEWKVDKWMEGKKQILFVTGYSGSGKTTLSKIIAENYCVPHVEMDMLNRILKEKYGEEDYHAWTHSQYSDGVFRWIDETFVGRRVIIEGGQVLKLDFNKVSEHAILVMKSGFVKSCFRAIIRDFTKDHWERYKSIQPIYHIKKNISWGKRMVRFKTLMNQYLLKSWV